MYISAKRVGRSSLLMLAAACGGDDIDPSGLPGDLPNNNTEITFTVYLANEVAKNEGDVFVGFVAYQDGDGPWQLMPGANGVHTARIAGKRYGLAVGCLPPPPGVLLPLAATVSVHQSTTDETTSLRDLSCYQPRRSKPVTIVATGDAGQDTMWVQSTYPTPRLVTTQPISMSAPVGKFSVFGLTVPPGGLYTSPRKIVRAQDVDSSIDSPVLVDFSRAVEPILQPLNLPPGAPVSARSVVINQTSYISMIATSTSYRTIPTSMLRAGDLIRVSASTSNGSHSTYSSEYFAAPQPVSLTFGERIRAAPPTLTTIGAQRLPTYSFSTIETMLPFVDYTMSIFTGDSLDRVTLFASMSPAWIGDVTEVIYPFPDFSTLNGWMPSMALGMGGIWQVSCDEFSTREIVVGRRVLSSIEQGEIAP